MKKKKEKREKLPVCMGNFGRHHNYCTDECLYNVICEECSSSPE